MNMEKKTDLEIALELLKEEIEGAKKYKHYTDDATDPKVKIMLAAHLADEKTHVCNLLAWVTDLTNKWVVGLTPKPNPKG